MKKRITLAFAGLLLMLTASFAPIAQAPVPGSDKYVTMGGKLDGRLFMYVNNVANNTKFGIALPMLAPFVTRAPYLSPLHLFQNISFLPVNLDLDPEPEVIQISKAMLNPIVHTAFVPFRGAFWRFMLVSPQAGGGVIFVDPTMPGDVDCYTFNNDTGVYWDAPSQLAGKKAAESGGYYNLTGGDFVPGFASRFPSTGGDILPGTRLWGDPLDGFGDGAPDPPGSSILMLPVVLMGDEWNGTHWDPKIAVPMPLVMTTGTAFDRVDEPGGYPSGFPSPIDVVPPSGLDGLNSTEVGVPWDVNYKIVTYVCAWSNLKYAVNPDDDNDGIPDAEEGTGLYYTVDLFYEYVEKKVREDVVVADVNCDQTVDIGDIVLCAMAFGAEDEGLGRDFMPGTADDKIAADAAYDARVDLNCDGFIDIFDLVRIAIDFGKAV